MRWPWRRFVERSVRRFPLLFYAGGVCLLTFLATWGFFREAQSYEVAGWRLIFATLIVLVGVSQLAVALLNWLTTLLVRPRLLPRLDYSFGIPPESSAMVVIPTILGNVEEIDGLLEMIEIHHLANRDPHLHFALLTDWDDAATESTPADQALLERARIGVKSLNRKYAAGRRFVFHRPRHWNESDSSGCREQARKLTSSTPFSAEVRGCFSTWSAKRVFPDPICHNARRDASYRESARPRGHDGDPESTGSFRGRDSKGTVATARGVSLPGANRSIR